MKYEELSKIINVNIFSFDTYTIDGGEPKPTKDIRYPEVPYYGMEVIGMNREKGLFNIAFSTKTFYDFKFIKEDEESLTIEFTYVNKAVRIEIVKQYYEDDDATIVDYEANLDYNYYNFYILDYNWSTREKEFVYTDETDESSDLYDLTVNDNEKLELLFKEVLKFIETLKK